MTGRWVGPGVRAVFFDAVGTLLFPDPPALEVYAAVGRRAGLAISVAAVRDRFLAAYRREEEADRARGWVTSEGRERERWHRIVTASLRGVTDPDACFADLFAHFSDPRSWRVLPSAGLVLEGLRERGLVLGIGTNYDARVWSVLDGFPELASVRDRVVVSAAVGFRKPAPEFFREVARVAGCDPGEVLFVGDDVGNDYVGATAAGLNAVLYDPANESRIQPRIRDLAELLD